MKPERICGTLYKTMRKLIFREDYAPKRIARFLDGHVYSGHASSHLTPAARRAAKLRQLTYNNG